MARLMQGYKSGGGGGGGMWVEVARLTEVINWHCLLT